MSETVRDPMRYLQVWTDVLAQVLQETSAAPQPCILSGEAPADLTPFAETDFWVIVTTIGAVRGEMSIRCSAASTVRLAQMFMRQPGPPPAEVSSEHRDAVLELLRQVAGLAATALNPTWGDAQFSLDVSLAAPTWTASSTAWVQCGDHPATAPVMEIMLSAALMASLRPEAAVNLPEAMKSAPSQESASSSETKPISLDLLMDVELAVTLRFGQRRLMLREVLDLNPGAVIDLDRQVQEPVDMLLDGRVIARGEVVVLDGNYGLRVTEVAPAEH